MNLPESRYERMSAEAIREYALNTLRRIADLALIPPTLNTKPLPE